MSEYKFEVGENVRIINNKGMNRYRCGDIVKITFIYKRADMVYYRINHEYSGWFEYRFEKAYNEKFELEEELFLV